MIARFENWTVGQFPLLEKTNSLLREIEGSEKEARFSPTMGCKREIGDNKETRG